VTRTMTASREDWLLVALAAAEGAPLTPVQLQKSLFLLGQELPDAVGEDFYAFRPYNYGPFSSAVYADADRLADEGLVRIDRMEPGRNWAVYSATPEGVERALALSNGLPGQAVEYLRSAVGWTRKLTFSQLVSAIYARYPEQRANSVFVD